MKTIGSEIKDNKDFIERYNYQKTLWKKIAEQAKKTKLGGGIKAIEKLHSRNKLSARERIDRLIDEKTDFIELGLFTGEGMYEEYGGAPSSGTIIGIGKINARDFLIVANDATVKAGAWFPITAKKNLRAQEIAIENNIPIIYLVDSAGVFLPLQEDIFPDKEHFGRIFRNNAKLSAMGIPQIAAIMGPCVAGGAYLPIMSDESLIVRGNGSVFLAGSHLVKAAIGEVIENEELGGAEVQTNLSGVTDYICENDEDCLDEIRSIASKIKINEKANFNRVESVEPIFKTEEILGILPQNTLDQYDSYELIARLVDNSQIDEYKKGYGQTVITAYARIDGWAVGIVANQRKIVKTKSGEMQIGGVIYGDAANKASRFIMNCNQRKIPLLFLQDVTGFMVGSKAEHSGIIKDGAKMVNAVANSVVPKITIIVGNSYGAGNYAMCGKAYDPRFIFAYPNSQIAVMGGSQASNVLLDIKIRQMKKIGKELSLEEKNNLLEEIQDSYNQKSHPIYAAARLWIDEIINPKDTRKYISRSLEICNNNPKIEEFKVGVIQT